MRLLHLDSNDELLITRDLEPSDPYAILSHTWSTEDDDEVLLEDIVKKRGKDKPGYQKILFCGQEAKHDGLNHFWVDTCCIDKTSSAELNKAINSMFLWYQEAAKCYVYLSDVTRSGKSHETENTTWEQAFRESRWFTRGWTLQELLAPRDVSFFSREGNLLGDKESLRGLLQEITGIAPKAMCEGGLSVFPVDERLSWMKYRQTKWPEDEVYSLLGIFDVSMPAIYGEGKDKALARLRQQIEIREGIMPKALRSIHELIHDIDERVGGLQTSMEMIQVPRRVMQDERALALVSMSTNGKTRRKFGQSSQDSIVTHSSQIHIQCQDGSCGCVCHLGTYIKTPFFMNRLIGSITFAGVCPVHPLGRGEIKYSLPEWLTNHTIYFTFEKAVNGMPSLGLRFQRRLAWGNEDTIIRFSYLGDTEGIKNMLDSRRGFLDDTEPNHGLTALHYKYAVQRNHLNACQLLLQAGADRFAVDGSNMSPTDKAWEHIFSNRGTTDELGTLRSLFCTDDFECWGFSPLHNAVLGIEGPSLERLLDGDTPAVDINNKDHRQRTALHWATLRGDLKATQMLLEHHANVNATDDFYCTPLHYAVSSAFPRIVEVLILRKAKVNAVNKRGDTPLHYAARHQDDVETVKVLVGAGALIDHKNKLGNTPFAGAAITNRVSSGEFLLLNGADRHTSNKYGDTPLRETIHHNRHEFLKMLLQMGTKYNEVNKSGSSILHAVALEGDLKTVEILISFGVSGLDTSLRDGQGYTALELCDKRIGASDVFKERFSNMVQLLSYDLDTNS